MTSHNDTQLATSEYSQQVVEVKEEKINDAAIFEEVRDN